MNLSTRITSISNSLGTVGENKVDLALMLLETKSSEYWKETDYGSWKGFCEKEVALSHSSIYVYLKTAKLAKDTKFYVSDMKHVVAAIGWERFRVGLSKLGKGEVVNVVKFIKRFKDINLNERIIYEEHDSKLVHFSFSIPESVAEDLTNELVARGMRITNKSRTNASAALVKLVKEFVEDV